MKTTDYNLSWAAKWPAWLLGAALLWQIVFSSGQWTLQEFSIKVIGTLVGFFVLTIFLWILALAARGVYRLFGGKELLPGYSESREAAQDASIIEQGSLFRRISPPTDSHN